MTRRLVAATATLALSAGLAAAQDGPIKIGASLPLTGNFSVSGTKHEQGYQLCVDEINARGGILGRPLELIISDNRSDTATAIAQYERFINVDEVDAVYGTFSSRLTFPLAAILAKYGYVHPIPAGGALRIYTQGYDAERPLARFTNSEFLNASFRQTPIAARICISQAKRVGSQPSNGDTRHEIATSRPREQYL
jgi:branched-chain amino acid transport system substrate-binding protein